MAKPEKVDLVKSFTSSIKDKSLVFVEYHGINVEDLTGLRNGLRQEGSQIRVVKNTLAKRTLNDLGVEFDESTFKGMIATGIFDTEKFINSSKSVLKAEKDKKVIIRGGVYEGKSLTPDEVRQYASLQSKEELYGVLVGCLQGIVSSFVYVLDDVAKQKDDGIVVEKAEVASEPESSSSEEVAEVKEATDTAEDAVKEEKSE